MNGGLPAGHVVRAGLFLIGLGWIFSSKTTLLSAGPAATGAMIVLAVVLGIGQAFRESDSAQFKALLVVSEALLVLLLAGETGGLSGPTLFLAFGGALLNCVEFGPRTGWIYVAVVLLGSLFLPTPVKSSGLQVAVRLGAVLWAATLGSVIPQPRRHADVTPVGLMDQLDRAQHAARTQTQVRQAKEQELYAERRKLEGLMAVAHRMAVLRQPDELLATIVECALEQMQVEASAVLIMHGHELVVEWQEGLSDKTVGCLRCAVGQEFLGQLVLGGHPFHYTEADGATPFRSFGEVGKFANLVAALRPSGSSAKAGAMGYDLFHNFMVVPLVTPQDNRPFGLLLAINRSQGQRFNQHEVEYLKILATDAAISMRNLSFLAELERSHYEMIQALAQAIEAKDQYTHGHVARVRQYSVLLARGMGLPSQVIQDIDTAAILHDVGKISTPDHILMKPGPLTDDEFDIMKQHASNSVRILRDIRSVSPTIQKMVLHHHERWDGRGYPDKLAGDQIPLGAQIISVADCYDAMTSDRPYRKGFTPAEALKRMESGAGSQFNAEILGYFFAIFKHAPQSESEIRDLTASALHKVAPNLMRTQDPQQIAARANLMGAFGSAVGAVLDAAPAPAPAAVAAPRSRLELEP